MPSAERDLLVAHLDAQRRHVLGALDGLDDDQLRAPVLPSGWSPIGLVRHLTLADERYWCRSIIGGEPLDWFPDEPGADWRVRADEPSSAVLDAYRCEIARSNEVIASADPDDPPGRRDPLWDEWGIDFPTVRSVVLHLLVETATHAGHLDAVRELIDGRLWLEV